MPKQYEAIRDKFVSEGMPLKEAKTRAAKIYNSKHPKAPISGAHKRERVARSLSVGKEK